MTSSIIATPIAYSIHNNNESPVFSTSAIHVEMTDEGGGVFFRLQSATGDGGEGSVRITLEELEVLLKIARKMEKKHD